MSNSSSPFLPLPGIERKPIIVRLEGNIAASREVKHIALGRLDLVARLVADVEVAFQDDFHLVVVVLVHERSAFLKSVEAASNRTLLIILHRRRHVAQECVLVRDERRLEVGLHLLEVVHRYWLGGTHLDR